MAKNADGPRGEEYAAEYLTAKGYAIAARNYRTRYGEIDLIAERDGVLAFVEVKTRRTSAWGGAAGAVTAQKQHKLILAAQEYLQTHPGDLLPRFDVVAITTAGGEAFRVLSCEHYEGAFALGETNGF